MNERQTYLAMCRAMPGGAEAMAAALGLTRSALDNRIYERRGQTITVDQALQMAEFTGSPLFAQMVAARCGGVFVPLPPVEECDRMDLLERWTAVYAELGELSKNFQVFTSDGEVDAKERGRMLDDVQDVHRALRELIALTFKVYCREEPSDV